MVNKINPRNLFLADSLGALLSAILLGLVLARFESIFGMPQKVLYVLSSIAFVFCIYSFLCFLLLKENWRPFLKIIGIANLLYCFLTLGLVIYLYQELTVLGITYFALELIVILVLISIELKTAFDLYT